MKRQSGLWILLLLLIGWGCNQHKSHNNDKWSQSLAQATISRNDSLVRYNNQSKMKWQFDLAMLGQALMKVDPQWNQYHRDYIDCFVTENGTIKNYLLTDYNLDHINPGKGLFDCYRQTGETKYRLAIELLMSQLTTQPRTKEGAMWHKLKYPNQIWLNSTYMVAPFMARYAQEFNQPQWFDSACHLLIVTNELLLDPTDGLHFQACDPTHTALWANSPNGCSPNKWLRASGWYLMALVDVLEILPASHSLRPQVETILKHSAEALLQFRDSKSKLWFQIPNLNQKEYNFIETSGSAMGIYAFAKGARLDVLPSKYSKVARNSFLQLTKHYVHTDSDQLPTLTGITDRSGLGGPSNLDGNFDSYINQKFVDNDAKGFAPLIMAALELGY